MLTFSFGENYEQPCALVLGGFDGLHLGHRRLLFEAESYGLPVVLTTMFGGKGKSLFTKAERRFLFERADVSAVCEIAMTENVRTMSADRFARELFSHIHVRVLVCGEDFRFGKDAAGTPALLKQLAPCPVRVIPPVRERPQEGGMGRKISTSSCKRRLVRGELALLGQLLSGEENFFDRAYFIGGEVEHGRGIGHTYGFPTLNLTPPPEKLLPPAGVYGGLAATPKGNFPCIINIGPRPTFGEGKAVEAYLDGFSGDLYGAFVRIYPTEFFRPIEKFEGTDALKAQLERDIAKLGSHQ